jgi:hypothetical protein
MARKTLLTESEIRQFMKLANIKPLQEMGMGGELPVPGMRDEEEDEPGMRDYMQEAEEEEMEMDAEEAPAPEGGEEMDMEMGVEEPAGDMEMDMEMGAEEPAADMDIGGMDADGGKEEQFADIVDKLADLLGLDADVEVGGEEEMEMGGEVDADEGGDLEMADAAPEAPEMEMGDDDIVQEVARRVAARLLREKKQEDVANKLAERIFRRLASK